MEPTRTSPTGYEGTAPVGGAGGAYGTAATVPAGYTTASAEHHDHHDHHDHHGHHDKGAEHFVQTPSGDVHEHSGKTGAKMDETWQKTKAAMPGTKEHKAKKEGGTVEHTTSDDVGYGTTETGYAGGYGAGYGANPTGVVDPAYGTTGVADTGMAGAPVAETESLGVRPGGILEGKHVGSGKAGVAPGATGAGYGYTEGVDR